ncbi:MAG: zinc-dependent metalloprotease [Bacteroidaceae bacterium]|nr:zinc-dependent metalloprotease [Bacteroidaceae bacterium]
MKGNFISKSLCGSLLLALAFSFIGSTPASARLFKKKKAKTAQQAPQPKPQPKPSVDREGLFHVTKMKEDWFFVIPDSLMGRDFLTTTRFTSTPAGSGQFGGEQLNEQTVYFEMVADSQIVMRARLLINYADSTQQINKAITISNENPIIGTFKVEKREKDGFKIKVKQFFNEDNPAIGVPQNAKRQFNLTGQVGGYIEDIKSFPTNTEVRLVKTYGSTSTSLPAARATGKVTVGLNISFVLLPKVPMMPRYYDPRVGYFTEDYNNYTDDQQRVKSVRYIARYRLEPRPEDVEKMRRGELVEPVKPIVYYIDPATPKQWRKYLIQGVNDWQKAFEQAGFKNAIRGEEWPEDSTMSMEDARYCVIRYLASPIANAYGPHVSDPRSGEIIESHICWYHNVMSLVHDWYMVQASSIDEAARKMHYDEELMGQLIRFVSSHEVGHSLGLRHNFGSSSTVPVDSLRNKAWVEKYGHTPSIMDYARFNYVAQPEDGITQAGIFPRINDYDKWAIQWGYTPMLDAKNVDEDHKQIEALIGDRLKNNKRLWWGDGEGYRNDPRRQTEDLGDDAVKASEYGIKNLKREIVNLQSWTKDESDIYGDNLSTMWNQIATQFMRYNNHVIGNIGGTLMNYRTADEAGDIYAPQPRAKQLAALEYVKRNIINEPTWLREVSYAMRLTSDPQSLTLSVGRNAVNSLINRLSYLNDTYKADEYLNDLTKMIMPAAAKTDRYHEEMQTYYVQTLIDLFKNSTSTLRPAVLSTLKQLKTKTASSTLAHYQNLNDLISRALVIK